jgi:hypothetical protein
MKMTPGLSSFASRVEGVGEYLTPLFENAATVVPPAFQASTEVYILGTAGKICNEMNLRHPAASFGTLDIVHPFNSCGILMLCQECDWYLRMIRPEYGIKLFSH